MNNYRFDKRSCYARARNILDTGDDFTLRYACLELRFCIEAITYDKLRFYAPRLPVLVIETWQPPQAMKALVQIEPDAASNYSIAMSPEDSLGHPTGEWMSVGAHKSLPVSWITKIYNKLGSYLHIPNPKK